MAKPLDQIEDEELYDENEEVVEEPSDEGKEMSFLEHLEELRWHLIRAFAAVFILMVVAFLSKDFVFGTLIFGPTRTDFWTYKMMCKAGELMNSSALCIDNLDFKIQSRRLTGQFFMHISASAIVGFIAAFPYVFWEIWSFVRPGLYNRERKAARGATFFVSLLFIIGVLFGYYIVSPLSINFLSNYKVYAAISNEFDIVNYVTTVSTLVLACGVLFQLPVVSYFLGAAGLLTHDYMKRYRRHALVMILVLSAVLTPPDISSQVLIAIPLGFLYEISILIVKRVEKRYQERLALEEEEE